MKKTILAALCLLFATPCFASVDVDALITKYAAQYDVSAEVMTKVVTCESYEDTQAIGDSGNSLGLVQIDILYHPEVTRAEAFDPDFALNFLASNLAKNRGYLWTCYREMIK